MAGNGRAVESRELRTVSPAGRTSCDPYQHGADGRRGAKQPTHHHCERRILAERYGASADNGNLRKGAWPLRARGPLTLVDGSNPQDHANASAPTRGPTAGDAAQATP